MKIFFTVLVIFLSFNSFGQNSAPGALSNAGNSSAKPEYKIVGKVIDGEGGAPLEYATISILNPGDSSIVDGGITGADGTFSLNAKEGTFLLGVQFISYRSKYFTVTLSKEKPIHNLGTVTLSPDTETLDEVVIQGRQQQMTMELDKRIFNVGQDLSNISGTAADVLDNIPSVNVDIEGNVSLRGSQNVRILVNGKPSGLVGISSTDALRQLQGNMIERVEVVTNPSARYEAQGNAGIINIILKKEDEKGINGSFNVNTGVPHNHGASFNLNYRRSWLNLFASYGIDYRRNPGSGFTNQQFLREDTTFYHDITNDRLRAGWSNTFRIGSDFFLNEFNTITVSGLLQLGDEENTTEILYKDFDENEVLQSQSLRFDNELEDERDIEFALNYTKTFSDDENRKLTADIQYRESKEVEDAEQLQGPLPLNAEQFQPDVFQRSLNDEFENTLLLQTDYVHPFSKDGKFEAGYRGSIRTIDNAYVVEQKNEDGVYENLEGFTNDFTFDENIQAGYVIYGNKWGRFTFQGGLRVEVTRIKTLLEQTNERNDKNYTDFFPSAHMTFDLLNNNNVQVSYSRRIDRPGFWSLNPFSNFTDPLNIRAGNPDLDPEYTDSYELGYLKNWPTGSLYTSVYYRHSTGVIDRIRYIDVSQGDSITYSIPQNLSLRDAIGVEFTYSQDIGDWWRLNGTANFFHQKTEGNFREQDLSNETFTMSTRVTSQMTLWDVLEYQVSFNYRAPQQGTQGKQRSFYTIDMGVSKEIFKGKGTLTFNVRDILNSRKWRGETITEGLIQYGEFQWRARQATLTLNYRLNQKKSSQGRREGGGYEGGEGEF
jgi:outer membrane receptor protein involved in Fe transport